MKIYKNLFNSIISAENLFSAWEMFKEGKGKRRDVLEFESNLEGHIFKLHRDLRAKTYKHGPYSDFYITDPKQRHIHKAIVRDRVLHHAIFSVINPIFEETFIPTSFSCRIGFGTHRGVSALGAMTRKEAGKNNTRPCFVLKCDIRKFFDSIDHAILLAILERRIKDKDAMDLLTNVVDSFSSSLPKMNRERERVYEACQLGTSPHSYLRMCT